MSLNPNSAAFNPNAASFVPGQPAAPAAAPEQPAESWEDARPSEASAAVDDAASKMEAVKLEDSAKKAPDASGSAAPKPKQTQAEVTEVDVPTELSEDDKKRIQTALDQLNAEDPREHVNVVFIGHVDAGKSTLGGRILFLTGGVDDRTIEKYEKEAKEKNRDSWYMAYIMDTNEEERAKGKTVEVGRAHFATDKRRYTVLDAPGHKNYVPNMISGAAQADVGVMVISARKGEFEAGFDRGGQTREHAQLAKTLGVQKLICVVNKLDEPSVLTPDGKWSKERYDQIVAKMGPFLRSCGYKPSEVVFLPLAGLHGHNVAKRMSKDVCDFYDGPCLFEVLDAVEMPPRDPLAGFRMPIMDKFKDLGCVVMGKSEQGIIQVGDNLMVMPNKVRVKVSALWRDEDEVQAARPGENLRIRLQGIDDEDIQPGFVLTCMQDRVPCTNQFEAQLVILDLLEHKSLFTPGYKAVCHIHSACEDCEVTKIVYQLDMKTKEQKKVKFAKSGSIIKARLLLEKITCLETFERVPQLGRFTLRDEGRTIAIGKVTKLPKTAYGKGK
ncbi:unnamed protein product [Pedinophyceae sp. YPF-701]|nr:unnamed protein product [Pedinophyceae sp. YPF-701]